MDTAAQHGLVGAKTLAEHDKLLHRNTACEFSIAMKAVARSEE